MGAFFKLILAENYLDVKGLLGATYWTGAKSFRRTPQSCKPVHMRNDFTAEESFI